MRAGAATLAWQAAAPVTGLLSLLLLPSSACVAVVTARLVGLPAAVVLLATVCLAAGSVWVHELGHLLALRVIGIDLSAVVAMPGWTQARLLRPRLPRRQERIVALSGPLLPALLGLTLTAGLGQGGAGIVALLPSCLVVHVLALAPGLPDGSNAWHTKGSS